MARYHVKGMVYLTVTQTTDETERIDDIVEADSLAEAERKGERLAEDEYDDADEVSVDFSRLTVTIIEETQEERYERERKELYRDMVASGAPRLPGMAVA